MIPYIKTGDSFAVPIQFIDTETQLGMPIDSTMEISCEIVNSAFRHLATPTVTVYPDQVVDAGFILIEVPPSETLLWNCGSAQLDIKLEMGGAVRHSQNIKFNIERSITQ